MTERVTVATRLAGAVSTALGAPESPWRLRAWDGSEAGPADAPVLVVRSPQAVRRLVWAPGELGLVRAYVAGEIDLEGDVFATLEMLRASGRLSSQGAFPRPSARDWLELGRTAAALHAVGAPPAPPPRSSRGRTASAGTAPSSTPRRSPTTTTWATTSTP